MPWPPDPFDDACARAAYPTLGLLNVRNIPECFSRVKRYLGKTEDQWNAEDWLQAARILGFFVDELQRRQRLAQLLNAMPKKRGPKPRKPQPLLGILSPPKLRRPPGRKRVLPEVIDRDFLRLIDDYRSDLEKERGRCVTTRGSRSRGSKNVCASEGTRNVSRRCASLKSGKRHLASSTPLWSSDSST